MGSVEAINIWFDHEGNRLTVVWGSKKGYYTATDNDRVLARVDLDGNVQGLQVEGVNELRDTLLTVNHSIEWWKQLDKKRGSRPRCVLLMDGESEEVAERLTALVDIPEVVVTPADTWMPFGKPLKKESGSWDVSPAKEVDLGKPNLLVPPEIQEQLERWWLAVAKNARTPRWDIASTCTIRGTPGLLLVEAKAHAKEISPQSDKCKSTNADNRARIEQAIREASAGLRAVTEGDWGLSPDRHYQLSNRFAWAWKLASLGVPVVLLYLGFLEAHDMVGEELFRSLDDWGDAVKSHGEGVVDNTCWDQCLDVSGTPLIPLIRVCDQKY